MHKPMSAKPIANIREMTCDPVPGKEPLRHIAVELKWKCKF